MSAQTKLPPTAAAPAPLHVQAESFVPAARARLQRARAVLAVRALASQELVRRADYGPEIAGTQPNSTSTEKPSGVHS